MKLIISLVILSLSVMAHDTGQAYNESGANDVSGLTETVVSVEQDQISQFQINLDILQSGKSFRYMKNPCAGITGYRFQRTRGFGFENGTVKYFQLNGQLSVEKTKYASFAQFMSTRKLCSPTSKKVPAMSIDIATLLIW